MSSKVKRYKGFTLPELMISAVIMISVFAGVLLSFIKNMELSELSHNMSLAMTAVSNRVEVIHMMYEGHDVIVICNNATFTDPLLNGVGISYVTEVDANHSKLIVSFCWRQKNGRVIGEDKI